MNNGSKWIFFSREIFARHVNTGQKGSSCESCCEILFYLPSTKYELLFIALSSYYARKMCNRDALELHVLFIGSVFKAFILL